MAIQISGHTFNLNNGLTTDQTYIRLEVSLDQKGDTLKVRNSTYYSKDYYISGTTLNIPIYIQSRLDYNRDIDGNDILEIAHIKVKEQLVVSGIDTNKITFVDITFD